MICVISQLYSQSYNLSQVISYAPAENVRALILSTANLLSEDIPDDLLDSLLDDTQLGKHSSYPRFCECFCVRTE